MELYLVRHGQSEANAGLTLELDSKLTEIGRTQAKITADRLASEGITRAFVSPLLRTLQTIEPICEKIKLRATAFPLVCEYFSAKSPGFLTFEGLSPQTIRERFPFVDISTDFSCTLPWWPQQFETRQTAFERAVRVRDEILKRFANTDEKILIVSHADPIGQLIEAFTRIDPHPEYPPWSDNCAITRLDVPAEPGAPATVIIQNDTSHLPPDYRTTPSWAPVQPNISIASSSGVNP
jgi:broad specificity phosphatase PhoE